METTAYPVILEVSIHARQGWRANLPHGLSEVDETEETLLPHYNRIFIHGEAGGVFADLTRPGTAGDVLKPMVMHPLITTIDAAKARVWAELSESGLMLRHKMTLPVLPATGVIKPGTTLRHWDDLGAQRLGMVDATAVATKVFIQNGVIRGAAPELPVYVDVI